MYLSATQKVSFERSSGTIETRFNLEQLASNGGLLWLAEVDDELGLCAALAQVIPEWRRDPVRHTLQTLVRQRFFQIACS